MKPALLQVHGADTVAVCLRDVEAGERLTLGEQVVEISAAAARGHKIALRPHMRGAAVIKYGHPIGHATEDIATGAPVHLHNLASDLAHSHHYTYREPVARAPRCLKLWVFNGSENAITRHSAGREGAGYAEGWGEKRRKG